MDPERHSREGAKPRDGVHCLNNLYLLWSACSLKFITPVIHEK